MPYFHIYLLYMTKCIWMGCWKNKHCGKRNYVLVIFQTPLMTEWQPKRLCSLFLNKAATQPTEHRGTYTKFQNQNHSGIA